MPALDAFAHKLDVVESLSSVRTCVYPFAVTARFRWPTCSPIRGHGTPEGAASRFAGAAGGAG